LPAPETVVAQLQWGRDHATAEIYRFAQIMLANFELQWGRGRTPHRLFRPARIA
jgi:hypothetical protein